MSEWDITEDAINLIKEGGWETDYECDEFDVCLCENSAFITIKKEMTAHSLYIRMKELCYDSVDFIRYDFPFKDFLSTEQELNISKQWTILNQHMLLVPAKVNYE